MIRISAVRRENCERLERLRSALDGELDGVDLEYQERLVSEDRLVGGASSVGVGTGLEDQVPRAVEIAVGYLTIRYVDGAVSEIGAAHGERIRTRIEQYIGDRDSPLVELRGTDEPRERDGERSRPTDVEGEDGDGGNDPVDGGT